MLVTCFELHKNDARKLYTSITLITLHICFVFKSEVYQPHLSCSDWSSA